MIYGHFLHIKMFHQNSPEILPPSRLILIAPAGAMCRRRPFALAQKGGRKPINAKCETVHSLPTFRDVYRRRRCILPVDGFFEWKAIKGQKAKQPYAIAMKNGSPFGIGGLWENWKEFGGVIVPLLRFWCGARRYAHLTHLDCAVGVPFLWCCYR